MKRKYFIWLLILSLPVLIIFRNHIFFAIQVKMLEKAELQYSKVDGSIELSQLSPSQKIWAHRVNSVERFQYLKDRFAGVEMDLVYDPVGNFLEVNHPPALSDDIHVEQLLRCDSNRNLGLYFDIKNLDVGNAAQIFKLIEKLDKLYRLKQRTIIESKDASSLRIFQQHGYFTSYYLSVSVCENIQYAGSAWAVSQEWSAFQDSDSCTGGINKLTWELSIKNWFDLSLIKNIANRKDVRIVLVNIKSPGYR